MEEDKLQREWQEMPPEQQHKAFGQVVKHLQSIDQNARSFHQHFSAWVGKRLYLMELCTENKCTKKERKNKGKYLIRLASDFYKMDRSKLKLQAAKLFHPLGGYQGTIALEVAQNLSLGALKRTEGLEKHPGWSNWNAAITRWTSYYNVKASSIDITEVTFTDDNPWEPLNTLSETEVIPSPKVPPGKS
jgi:hypothetical protein